MQKGKYLSVLLASLALPGLAIADDIQSNTVPTSQLEADFAIVNSDTPNMAQVVVQLAQAVVIDGVEHDIPLAQSNNEVVTVSVGSSSMTYDPNDTSSSGNLLPLRSDGVYHVTFKRFNGEEFRSTVTLPATPVFTKPAPNTYFQRKQEVQVEWQPITADGAMGELEVGNCPKWGDFDFHWEGSLHFDSNFTDQCDPGAIPMILTFMTQNEGKGYGLTYGLNQNSLEFGFDDANKVKMKKLTVREKVLRFLNSHSGPHALITIKH